VGTHWRVRNSRRGEARNETQAALLRARASEDRGAAQGQGRPAAETAHSRSEQGAARKTAAPFRRQGGRPAPLRQRVGHKGALGGGPAKASFKALERGKRAARAVAGTAWLELTHGAQPGD